MLGTGRRFDQEQRINADTAAMSPFATRSWSTSTTHPDVDATARAVTRVRRTDRDPFAPLARSQHHPPVTRHEKPTSVATQSRAPLVYPLTRRYGRHRPKSQRIIMFLAANPPFPVGNRRKRRTRNCRRSNTFRSGNRVTEEEPMGGDLSEPMFPNLLQTWASHSRCEAVPSSSTVFASE